MSNWKPINVTYQYDGTFDGLLTIVFDSFVSKTIPKRIVTGMYESNLLDKEIMLETNEQKATRVYDGIVNNISYFTLYNAHHVFLSNEPNKEMDLFQYLVLGFKIGKKIDHLLSDPLVLKIQKTARRVKGESHRLSGLLRFSEVGDNLYYATIHPDNNVTELLGHHFMKRLPLQNFIIHDKKRDIALLYNTKTYTIIEANGLAMTSVTEEEKKYRELWKTFYHTIGIKERKNSRLQMQYMPKKYWQDLVEKQL